MVCTLVFYPVYDIDYVRNFALHYNPIGDKLMLFHITNNANGYYRQIYNWEGFKLLGFSWGINVEILQKK